MRGSSVVVNSGELQSTCKIAKSRPKVGRWKTSSTLLPDNETEVLVKPKKKRKQAVPYSSGREHNENDVWFDDIPSALIAASKDDQSSYGQSLVKPSSYIGCTKRIGMDCEFVGVGYEGKEHALARVSIVNQFGHVLLDAYVRPKERVTDYRTAISGIRPSDLKPGGKARSFHEVHREVAKLCKGRVLVGHALSNDLKVLMLSHPRRDIRDTSRYRPFRLLFAGRQPSLRDLTARVLGISVQQGEHDSVEDARAAMRLYTSVKRVWESKQARKMCQGLEVQLQPGVVCPSRPPKAKTPGGRRSTVDSHICEYESGLETVPDGDRSCHNPPALGPRIGSSRQSTLFARAMAPITDRRGDTRSAVRWDAGRSRRCSKKRSHFVAKRQQRQQRQRVTKQSQAGSRSAAATGR